jgi:hypothetical protein
MSLWLKLLVKLERPLSRLSAIPTNRDEACSSPTKGCSKVLSVEFQK